jgi:hypothetical protein
MKTFQQILVCALLSALTALVVCTILLLRAATATVAAIPGEIAATRVALVEQVAQTRTDLDDQILFVRQDLQRAEEQALGEVRATRGDAVSLVEESLTTADRRVGDTLARADVALEKVEEIRGDLKPVLDHAGSVAKQMDETAPMFLDCEFNPDCAFNRFQGTSKAFERAAINFGQMSQDVRVALPGFVKNANSLVADSAATAANIKRLTTPKWYDRLIGYGLNGVVIYRNLNPVTNLTIKGAQILASRP